MTRTGFFVRLAIAAAIDLADFTIGRALFAIPWEEAVGAGVLTLLWGPMGLIYVTELLDFTEQFDAFIPMATIIGLVVGWQKGVFKKEPAPPATPEAVP